MDSLPWTDIVLLVVLLGAAVDGYRRGFIVHASDVLTLVPAIWLTTGYSAEAADWLVLERDVSPLKARIAAPLAIFVGVQVAGALLVWLLCRRLPEEVRTSRANHVAGIFPAVLKFVAYGAIVFAVVAAVPTDRMRAIMAESHVAPTLASAGRAMAGWVGFSVDEVVGRAFRNLTVSNRPHHETIKIPAVSDPARLRIKSEQEQELLALVNEERKRAGVGPLQVDDELREVARAHSRDMWVRGYFAHQDPDGRDAADRVRAARIRYGLVGENIALAPTLPMVHEGLMNSPDHRANILDARYKRLGIGIVLGGSNGLMVTQNFRD